MANVFDTFKKRKQHPSSLTRSLGACQTLTQLVLLASLLGFSNMACSEALIRTERKAKKLEEAPKKEAPKPAKKTAMTSNQSVKSLMDEVKATIKKRGYKWDLSFFTDKDWVVKGQSVNHKPLFYWSCGSPSASNRSVVFSMVHGDEVTPLYFGFRLVEWLKARPDICKDRFVLVAPLVNPDGFLRYSRGTRTNYNKVDVNRNFDTPDFDKLALQLWRSKYKQRRYYPGEKGGSEPETKFQQDIINEFKPSKILSIHSPLNILDYDGPQNNELKEFSKEYIESCESLKSVIQKATPTLNFFAYGVFPGSLGNYAGKQRGIPTFTVELPTTDPNQAAHYFGDLERGTELFLDFEVKELKIVKELSSEKN